MLAASLSYAVLAPDLAGYANFGAAGNPPSAYDDALDVGRSTVDGVRALRNVIPHSLTAQVVLTGHSQGGYTAMAGLAGATVLRGIEGFGASNHVHTTRILRLSEDLPVVIVIVDTPERIDGFLPQLDELIVLLTTDGPAVGAAIERGCQGPGVLHDRRPGRRRGPFQAPSVLVREAAPGGHHFNRIDTKLARDSRAEIYDFLRQNLKPKPDLEINRP